MSTPEDARKEFHTSSRFKAPSPYPPWVIRNDYPAKFKEEPLKWYDIDFKQHPREFLDAAKEYILEGNAENNFVVQKNTKRNWYHAPWKHYGRDGREPLNGLFWGSPRRISEKLPRTVQVWANSYFNEPAATLLHSIWSDPSNPTWNDHLIFPKGSFIFLSIFTDATGEELGILKNAPVFDACIAKAADDHPEDRVYQPRSVRLCQIEFRARTGTDTETGWVFGNFIFDGREGHSVKGEWNLVPGGLQWGNDPALIGTDKDDGKNLEETWYNQEALDLIKDYYHVGSNPITGWHGRLSGPTDNFISACISCHSVAQFSPNRQPTSITQDPPPKKVGDRWVQPELAVEKRWFRNIKPGTSFDEDSLSSDYNHSVHFGYSNYLAWKAGQDQALQPADIRPLSGTSLPGYTF